MACRSHAIPYIGYAIVDKEVLLIAENPPDYQVGDSGRHCSSIFFCGAVIVLIALGHVVIEISTDPDLYIPLKFVYLLFLVPDYW